MYTYTYAYTYAHTYLALGAGVVSGAIRGCGNQHVGFYVNLGAYYGVALPAGLIFAFSLGLGLTGLSMGLVYAHLGSCPLLAVRRHMHALIYVHIHTFSLGLALTGLWMGLALGA